MATYYWTALQRGTANIVYIDPICGNDSNDGTANLPKKTHTGAGTAKPVALPSVEFNSATIASGQTLYGTGLTTYKNTSIVSTGDRYDIRCINCTLPASVLQKWERCYIEGGTSIFRTIVDCVFKNVTKLSIGSTFYDFEKGTIFDGCTLDYTSTYSTPGNIAIQNNIYYNCSIRFGAAYPVINCFNYNIIHPNCLIAISTGDFKTIPQLETETGLVGMAAIEAAYKVSFPTSYLSSSANKVADPLFVDVTNGNYSVLSNSPALSSGALGYTNIGNVSVGKKINIVSDSRNTYNSLDTETASNAIFATDVVSSNSINDLEVCSQIIEFSDIVEIGKILTVFSDSQATNELLDTTLPYDTTSPISAGTALEDGEIYIVTSDSITYSSTTYQIGGNFKASGTGSFTGNGIIYKVTELPNIKTFGVRWKNTSGPVYNNTTTLVENSEYLVIGDSIEYDTVVRPVGSSFRCRSGITTFTGNGNVMEVFTSSDSFYNFNINSKPALKRVGNVVSGAIDITNGQKEYYTSASDLRPDFYIKAKYVQLKYNTKTNSLK